MEVTIGAPVTVFSRSSMAMTLVVRGKVHGMRTHRAGSQERFLIDVVPPRKHKCVSVVVTEDVLVFSGNAPFESDVEQTCRTHTGSMRGNACLNLVGDPVLIRDWVNTKNLNDTFTRFDEVMAIVEDKEVPVFPESETRHAVVEMIRKGAW